MTIEELLQHSEQALEAVAVLRESVETAKQENPFTVEQYAHQVAQVIPIYLQESQAYSQLAQARMQYEARSNSDLDESTKIWGSPQ